MKRVYVIPLSIVLAVATICLLLVTSVELAGFTPQIFSYHFEKSDIMASTNMSHDDLMKATNKLIAYMKDRDDDLVVYAMVDGENREVFNEREKLHMVDVKYLYQALKVLKTASLFAVLAILLLSRRYLKRGSRGMIFKYGNRAMLTFFCIFILIAAAFALDFQANFIRFHEMFFNNDLWLLDPETSILINMVPESYFYGMIMLTSGLFILFTLVFMLIYRMFWKKGY